MEWGGFSREVNEGASYFRIIGDEVSVKSSEPQEGVDVSDIVGLWPVRYSFDFCRVHLDRSVFWHHPKEFHFFLFEEAFFWFEV